MTFAKLLLSLSLAATLLGCASNAPPTAAPSVLTMTLTGPGTVSIGATAQYGAVVRNTSDQTVTWQVNGVAGGSPASGAISSTGLYTAPTTLPANTAITITATSVSTQATRTAPVTLTDAIPAITTATATTTTYGQTYLVDVKGTGFDPGAVLLINGAAAATYSPSAGELQALVPNGTLADLSITVGVKNSVSQSAYTMLTLAMPARPVTQEDWLNQIGQQNISPAFPSIGDTQYKWTAPDGRPIQLLVKQPAANPGSVTVGPVAAGSDARAVFDTALTQVRNTHAGTLLVPTGTYTFTSIGSGSTGQLQISNVSDLTIDCQGSTLLFTLNLDGIAITTSQRVKLKNCNIQYKLTGYSQDAYLATIKLNPTTNLNELYVNAPYTVASADTIGHMAQWNSTTNAYIQGGTRFYQPAVTYTGHQSYASSAFQSASLLDATFLVFEQYYGGVAVHLYDTFGPNQDEDITLDHVNIYSGPGMGINAYGLKRGLEVSNVQLTAKPGALISTQYDGMNMQLSGGDVYIHDSLIAYQGDDAVNLDNPISPVIAVGGDNVTYTLGTYSRFIQKGDLLSFFDANNVFLGTAYATTAPKALGGLNYSIVLGNAVPGVSTTSVVRDMNIVDTRTAFVNNTIRDCGCHGILVQTPNSIVSSNTFATPYANAIRVLTNIGTFVEGTGAVNVSILNNTISNTGSDSGIHAMYWSAISVYAASDAGVVPTPSNKYIDIIGNTVTNAQQGCITVASAELVNVTGNTCTNTETTPLHGAPSIEVLYANTVNINGNTRDTTTRTGGITVDAATTSNITVQPIY